MLLSTAFSAGPIASGFSNLPIGQENQPIPVETKNALTSSEDNQYQGDVQYEDITQYIGNDMLFLEQGINVGKAFAGPAQVEVDTKTAISSEYISSLYSGRWDFDLEPTYIYLNIPMKLTTTEKIHVHFNDGEMYKKIAIEGVFVSDVANIKFAVNGTLTLTRQYDSDMLITGNCEIEALSNSTDGSRLGGMHLLNFKMRNVKAQIDKRKVAPDALGENGEFIPGIVQKAIVYRGMTPATSYTSGLTKFNDYKGGPDDNDRHLMYYNFLSQEDLDKGVPVRKQFINITRDSSAGYYAYTQNLDVEFVEQPDAEETLFMPKMPTRQRFEAFTHYVLNNYTDSDRFQADMRWDQNPDMVAAIDDNANNHFTAQIKVTDTLKGYSKMITLSGFDTMITAFKNDGIFDSTPVTKKFTMKVAQQTPYFSAKVLIGEVEQEKQFQNHLKLAAKAVGGLGYSRVMLKIENARDFTGIRIHGTRLETVLPGRNGMIEMQIDYPDEITITAANADNAVTFNFKGLPADQDAFYPLEVDNPKVDSVIGAWNKIEIIDKDIPILPVNDPNIDIIMKNNFIYIRSRKVMTDEQYLLSTPYKNIKLALNLNYRLAGVKPIFATSLKDITQDDQQIIKLKNVDYFENVAVTNFIGDFEVAYAPDGYLVLTPLCANPDPKSINFTLLVDDKEYQFDALTDEAEYMDDINYDLPSDLINNDDNNDNNDNDDDDNNDNDDNDDTDDDQKGDDTGNVPPVSSDGSNPLGWEIATGTFASFSVVWFIISLIKMKKIKNHNNIK
jgi:hypothetical protein